jgi:hypothetical protein
MMKKTLQVVLGLLVVLIMAAAAYVWRTLPVLDGALTVPGLGTRSA